MPNHSLIFSPPNDHGIVTVCRKTGVEVGELIAAEDGYYVFWPVDGSGYWPGWLLRALADEIDRLNAAWDKQMQESAP